MVKICVVLAALFGVMLQDVSADVVKSTISIHAALTSFKPGAEIPIALRIEVPEGWYTYAEDPGDAGMPPDIRLHAPEGVEIGEWQFPPHETFTDSVGTYYGYKEEVVLRNVLTIPEDIPDNVHFKGVFQVVWMICKDVCLPFHDRVTLTLERSPEGDHLKEAEGWDALLLSGGWDKEENAE